MKNVPVRRWDHLCCAWTLEVWGRKRGSAPIIRTSPCSGACLSVIGGCGRPLGKTFAGLQFLIMQGNNTINRMVRFCDAALSTEGEILCRVLFRFVYRLFGTSPNQWWLLASRTELDPNYPQTSFPAKLSMFVCFFILLPWNMFICLFFVCNLQLYHYFTEI